MNGATRRRILGASVLALFAALVLCFGGPGCGLPPELETDPAADAAANDAAPEDTGSTVDTGLGSGSSLLRYRNAKIQTGFDNYIVRDVSFDTGEGFGSSHALLGHYNGTVWEYQFRFIKTIDVIGKIDASEARSAPNNYFARDEIDLRRTFRTRVMKTDGEVVEFVVRINAINGKLETGGALLLSRDELETLRRIEFF